jgi:hypothetical protein
MVSRAKKKHAKCERCGQDSPEKPKSTRPKRADGEEYPQVQLTARIWDHRPDGIPEFLTQSELMEGLDVSDQTIRNYMVRGLPWEKGPQGKPRYPTSDAFSWALQYAILESQKKAPRHLSIARVDSLNLVSQTLARTTEGDPEIWSDTIEPFFVIVPLEWNHPLRERMLRLAARGVRPATTDDDWVTVNDDGETAEEAYREVVAEMRAPLPRVEKSPPQ